MQKWLKPGGKVLITDYCHGDKENHSEEFVKYVMQRGYQLLSVGAYGQLLEKVKTETVFKFWANLIAPRINMILLYRLASNR